MALLYYVIYPSALADPSAAQIIAGQNATGSAATAAGNETATSFSGVHSFIDKATGLSPSTSYKAAMVWSNGTDNSNVVVSSAFATAATGQFLFDSFTEASDISLASHLPEIGGGWVNHGSPWGQDITVDSTNDRITGTSSSAYSVFVNNDLPPSPDYYVEAVVRRSATGAAGQMGVCARFSVAAPVNGYTTYYDSTSWALHKWVGGVSTLLGSYTHSPTVDTDYILRLEVLSDNITVFLDGLPIIAVWDRSVVQSGRPGIVVRSSGHVTSFVASELGEGIPILLTQEFAEVMLSPDPRVLVTQTYAEVMSRAVTSGSHRMFLPF